jgi:hypothetical protein
VLFIQCGSKQHGSRSDQKRLRRVLRKAVYPLQGMGLMVMCCGMAVKKMGKLGVSVRKMKLLTVRWRQ